MLEMDVCVTKDGELVVHHDLDLVRSCGVRGQIKEYDFGELPEFKEEVEVQFAEEGRVTRRNGEKIPTLR
jgi:glycerophosphoryl diester phosphodiesterase